MEGCDNQEDLDLPNLVVDSELAVAPVGGRSRVGRLSLEHRARMLADAYLSKSQPATYSFVALHTFCHPLEAIMI